ncbi:mechanosensitive ion channel [Candidatus Woesearchaeota archaeon]|nr:mechanosensitive ion channel [Candidatus Woesearchaeota archaeon]
MLQNYIPVLLNNPYSNFIIRTIIVIVVFFLLKILFSFYMSRLSNNLLKEKKESEESIRAKKTRISFLNKFISTVLFLLAVLFILSGIPQFKTFSYSLLASAGIVAVVIGFATQKTLSNVISGIFLALYEPFRVGDKIKIFEEYGEVEDLSLRHTVIRTWDNKRLVIPNSKIDEREIVNFSLKEEKVLWTTNIGISYDSGIDKAKKIMVDLAKKHPDNLALSAPKKEKERYMPFVRVTECADFSVNLRLYFWCEDAWTAWKMGFDLTESIKKEFDRKGIEIPFPYRTIVYKKDLEKKKKR